MSRPAIGSNAPSRYLCLADDLTVHYTVQGEGPPAVLVHGYTQSAGMWGRPIQAYLQQYYRCYALDLPGHGQSSKPPLGWYSLENFTLTLGQFCHQLDLAHILLIGFSTGGLISLNLALRQPELVANLILVNSVVRGDYLAPLDPLLDLERLVDRSFAQRLFQLYTKSFLLSIPVGLFAYAHQSMVFSPSFKQWRRQLGQCTVQSLFGSFRMVRQTDLSDRLDRLDPPALVITSQCDRVVPPFQAHLVHRRAGKQLAIIPDSGHLSLDEQPALFDHLIREYLALL